MRILLDECVTRKLKAFLPEFQVMTVGEMGYSGMKNGKLLKQAELAGFDLLLTIDKNIDSQQQISQYAISLVVFNVLRSNLRHFEPLIPIFKAQVDGFEKGKSYVIG